MSTEPETPSASEPERGYAILDGKRVTLDEYWASLDTRPKPAPKPEATPPARPSRRRLTF
jgi:hypothetical protein